MLMPQARLYEDWLWKSQKKFRASTKLTIVIFGIHEILLLLPMLIRSLQLAIRQVQKNTSAIVVISEMLDQKL